MSRNITNRTSVHLDVTPLDALVDEPIIIRLAGLLPAQTATLLAHTLDSADNKWASSATFVADSNGQIDVATQQPVAGSYHQIDPMGLFWSMLPVQQKPPLPFLTHGSTFVEIDLIVEIDGVAVAATRVKRRFVGEDVTSLSVREQGLVGTFFYPVRSEWLSFSASVREASAGISRRWHNRGYGGLGCGFLAEDTGFFAYCPGWIKPEETNLSGIVMCF